MNRLTQSIVISLLGGLLISITVSGRFTSYVRPGFAPLLLIGGIVLVLVGVASLILTMRAEAHAERRARATAGAPGDPADAEPLGAAADPDDAAAGSDGALDAHGHDHDSSKAPWLILVPVLVLLLVAPPALGADAVSRNAGSQGLAGMDVVTRADPAARDAAGGVEGGYKFNDGSGSAADSAGSKRTQQFPPLPEGADPALPFKDFVLRTLYDADGSVDGVPVTLTGFVAPPGDGFSDGYTIARMVISCCAADANPMQVHVAADAPFPPDTWVQAVVTAVPNTATVDNGYVPTVTITSIAPIPQPADPYEH